MKWVFILTLMLSAVIPILWLQQGCNSSYPSLTDMAIFTPTPTLQPDIVSNFESGGTAINPNLVNYIPGNAGFTDNIPTTSPVDGVIATPLVQSGIGYNSNYAIRVEATWSDCATCGYPSAALSANLYSGTTYYDLPLSLTGIMFYLNIAAISWTGSTAPVFSFAVPLASTIPTSGGGTCTGSECYDHFNASLPTTVTGGYILMTIPFSTLKRAGFGSSIAPCSQTNIMDGCNNKEVMTLAWAVASNDIPGNYAVDFRLDNITFY
jgi:hypothetical protein